jgi:formate hydrogenlyase subunit 3/multisubunit Na+/H+ antiporter MnhD subunit
MQIVIILMAFIIQGGRLVSTRAALRFLTLMSLATPMLLLAAWQLDNYQLESVLPPSPDQYQQTAFLIGFGFALWLAVAPFHSSLTTTGTDCYPASAAFVLVMIPTVSFSVLINLLQQFPELIEAGQLLEHLLIAGVFTAFVGGMLAGIQRGFSQLMSYAALYDLGCILTMLSLKGEDGLLIILVSLTGRAFALSLLVASAAAIRSRHPHDGFVELREIAFQMPVATAGLLIGGLGLAGFPFTISFVSRWEMFSALTTLNVNWSVLLGLSGVSVAVGYLRGLRQLLGYPTQKPLNFQEPVILLLFITMLAIANIVLGFFPSLLIESLQ